MAIIGLTLAGFAWAGLRLASGASHDLATYCVNLFWGVNNIAAMLPMVRAAVWRPEGDAGADNIDNDTLAPAGECSGA